jgi:hypothetical protein
MPILQWPTRNDDLRAAGRAPYRLLEEVPEVSFSAPLPLAGARARGCFWSSKRKRAVGTSLRNWLKNWDNRRRPAGNSKWH